MTHCELDRELCRICLDVGADIPLFEKTDVFGDSVEHKLFKYINQKIEDTEGYPRRICIKCNTTVNLICDFVNKLRDSNKTLQQGLQNIKLEQDSFSDHDYYDEHFIEEVTKTDDPTIIKIEPVFAEDGTCIKDTFNTILNSKQLKIKKIKTEPDQGKEKKPRPTIKAKNKTNQIASSILEGTFEWTGSKWCVISSTTIKKVKPKNIRNIKKSIINSVKKKVKREPAIKIPKIKESQTPSAELCDICGKTFKKKDKLRAHKKTHEEPNNIPCTDCGKILKNADAIRKHKKFIHSEKKFICPSCGAGFALCNHLTRHIKVVHEKHLYPPKLYKCSYCPKAFKAKMSTEIHERSVHTGLRPAVCSVCDASFYHHDYLKQHMRLHTGETPFKCPVCSRGYAQCGNMKSHIHHNHRISQLTEEQLAKISPVLLKYFKP